MYVYVNDSRTIFPGIISRRASQWGAELARVLKEYQRLQSLESSL